MTDSIQWLQQPDLNGGVGGGNKIRVVDLNSGKDYLRKRQRHVEDLYTK